MNKTFIPDVAPDGSEHGQRPAPGPVNQPKHPTECIKLSQAAMPVWEEAAEISPKAWAKLAKSPVGLDSTLISDVAQITPAGWASLLPDGCSGHDWEGTPPGPGKGLRGVVTRAIQEEKRGKIFPVSWTRIQEIVALEWQKLQAAQGLAERDAADARLDLVGRASTHLSLERGLAVLEIVAGAGHPVRLAETAARLGLHRSTAHHLMQTLVRTGYLRQQEHSRAYELTQKLLELQKGIPDAKDPVKMLPETDGDSFNQAYGNCKEIAEHLGLEVRLLPRSALISPSPHGYGPGLPVIFYQRIDARQRPRDARPVFKASVRAQAWREGFPLPIPPVDHAPADQEDPRPTMTQPGADFE